MEVELVQYEDTLLFQMILNILLVQSGARDATLIELLNNIPIEDKEYYRQEIDMWIKKFDLHIIPDYSSSERFFIVKNESLKTPETQDEIATLLGFLCIGHDFSNDQIERIGGIITEQKTGAAVYAEYCEASKISKEQVEEHFQKYVDRFNQAIQEYDLPYRFTYKVTVDKPLHYYLERASDQDFVKNNLFEYITILQNYYFERSRFILDHDLFSTHPEIFQFIIEKIQDGSMEDLYQQIKETTNNDYEKIMEAFITFENELFNTHISQ
jgi:hypothetical protein